MVRLIVAHAHSWKGREVVAVFDTFLLGDTSSEGDGLSVLSLQPSLTATVIGQVFASVCMLQHRGQAQVRLQHACPYMVPDTLYANS